MGDFGIKISRSGFNIFGESDYRRISSDTTKNTLKVFMEDFETKSITSLDDEPFLDDFLITHNLGYNPAFFMYIKHPEIGKWFKASGGGGLAFSATWSLFGYYEYVDKDDSYNPSVNKITMYIYDGTTRMPSSPTNVDVKYFVLADPEEDAWYDSPASNTSQAKVGSFGIRASGPGVDVLTAEKKNLTLDTSFPYLKPTACLKFSSAGNQTHGMGFPPAFVGVMETGSSTGVYTPIENDILSTTGESLVCVDDTKVYYSGSNDAYITLFANPLDE